MSYVNGVTGIEFFIQKNIAIVINNKYKKHNFAQLLIGHNHAHLQWCIFIGHEYITLAANRD